jgi:hypothetical protein
MLVLFLLFNMKNIPITLILCTKIEKPSRMHTTKKKQKERNIKQRPYRSDETPAPVTL